MVNFICWFITIAGLLYIFDVPQKLYKKLTQHKNVEEAESGRREFDNLDD